MLWTSCKRSAARMGGKTRYVRVVRVLGVPGPPWALPAAKAVSVNARHRSCGIVGGVHARLSLSLVFR